MNTSKSYSQSPRIRWSTPVDYIPLAEEERGVYRDGCITLGSCFSNHIGSYLYHLGYKILINPFGTLYNPKSIADSIDSLLSTTPPLWRDFLVERDSIWFSFKHHSRYHHTDPDLLMEHLNSSWQEARKALFEARWLMITLGTSHYATHKERGFVISNCHKIPSSQFSWNKLSVEETESTLSRAITHLCQMNPDIRILFSISPVRYLHYGMMENMLSKSTLRIAVDRIVEKMAHTYYFPSLELMVDELRDYRFYDSDLIHPSPDAIEYIAEHFLRFWSSSFEEPIRNRAVRLRKLSQHRPLVAEQSNKLNRLIEEKQQQMQKEYPLIRVTQITDSFSPLQ